VKRILEQTKYLALIGVLASLIASILAFLYGAIQTAMLIIDFLTRFDKNQPLSVAFIGLMDTFLIASVLYIFAVGLYELFIGDLALPEWLIIHTLDDLKSKVSSVIILVMAITFVEHLTEWHNATDTLFFGLSVAVVAAALIAYNRYGGSSHA